MRALFVSALAVMIVGAGPVAARPLDATRVTPKVVLIVGPAGGATPYYKRLADQTAAAAARFTTNIVKVYSPDATWPAVKTALQGASIVVYLGHGNGWPSIYRDRLYPPSQNGFGLNPHAGAADAHQYFGEEQIGSQVKLAPNAVVVFSHLCYASGNSEPGLAEGTLDQAQQRVDNYAAGFFRAGAGAVIADAYLAPTYYVTSILRGRSSIDSIWRAAPNRNDHFLRFDSQRSKGAIAQMDPDEVDSGFHRSIVLKASLASSVVLAGAMRRPGEVTPFVEPSLSGLGITFGAPDLTSPPTAGTKTTLVLPLARDAAATLPKVLMVGTRWDSLEPSAAIGTGAGGTVAPGTAPEGDTDPGTTATTDAAGIDLVVPERTGEIVAPVKAKRLAAGGLAVPLTVPSSPGLYRLVATIHDADGVAFDAATQALVPALVVRVIGGETAAYDMAPTATAKAGGPFALQIRVTNLGRSAWGHATAVHIVGQAETEPASRATLVARWVDLGGAAGPATPAGGSVAMTILPAGLAPGRSVDIDFQMAAPAAAGEYLLVLDVVDPRTGSLAASGVPPGIVRVSVTN
ncbi:MAG TPA: hypothetical protein VFY18_03350 [Candidatus Limnocylindrales bacterium]|nr:hypothetical protein [Candidatus Limnocylindrales bacterium]